MAGGKRRESDQEAIRVAVLNGLAEFIEEIVGPGCVKLPTITTSNAMLDALEDMIDSAIALRFEKEG